MQKGAFVFSENKQINRLVHRVMDHVGTLNRGDVLAHETIEKLTQCVRYSLWWGTIIRKFRNRLRQARGIACRPVVNVGYKLLTEDEQLSRCPQDRQKRAIRQLSRGIQEITAMNSDDLTFHQRCVKASSLQNMRASRLATKRSVRRHTEELATHRSDALPR